MSSKTFFGTPRKFCRMCGVVGIKDSPIIITYYFLFVNKRRKNCGLQGSGSPQRAFSFIITYILLFVKYIWRADVMKVIFFNKKDDDNGVIVRIWMGPVAPTLTIYNISIYNTISSAYFSAHLPLLPKNIWFYSTFYITNRFISSN